MEKTFKFTPEEFRTSVKIIQYLRTAIGSSLENHDEQKVRKYIHQAIVAGHVHRDVFGLNPILTSLQTAQIAVDEIGLHRDGVIATLLYGSVANDDDHEEIDQLFGENVARIVMGLAKIQKLYEKNPVIESENFRNLLLSFAEDMRVILIMIADRVNIMRQIRDVEQEEARHEVSEEASYLYAPLAHKLGLYGLKSELEDLSLKYLEHDAYYMIKEELNATKKSRDAYIQQFIAPIQEKLTEAGLKFHMKGRTKSIHSIWQKMKKQKCGFKGIYDLFAIRIILDSPYNLEKQLCWQAYSIVTDMYQPNPKRLRDWLSVPKSNGYESLHITVLGPESKWVEVQIRTERMDDIAEHGLAAHWRYKGIKSGGQMDEWLANIRAALEAGDNMEVMDNFKMTLAPEEMFVFTPKGDLFKFPAGATVLDFAYRIHSKIGNTCVGGRVNGKVVPMRQELHSGDSVEILTQSNQTPKHAWLSIVTTAKARAKIRLALKETQVKDGLYAKEHEARSAEEFEYEGPVEDLSSQSDDVLTIDQNLKGIDYQLASCCHPIYGDKIFGFVTAGGGIKIHRTDCPNAPEMRRRFGYRIVRARWSGKGTSQYSTTLKVIGNDDIGIISNITSIISKEEKILMRSINIDSHDGLFSGNLVVQLEDTTRLQALIKKLKMVKGVKQVQRI